MVFSQFLNQLGAEIVYNQRFLDHHHFTEYEISSLFAAAESAAAEVVITTEKDAVRVAEDVVSTKLPFMFLRLEVEILSGVDDFEQAVSRVCFPKQRNIKGTRSPFIRNR